MILCEAVEASTIKPDQVVSTIKKTMNICKLAKFKSDNKNAEFYSMFFLCTLEGGVTPTVDQWGTIYTTLLSEPKFCNDLAAYMTLYQPAVYTGLFVPLWNLIQSEFVYMKKNRIEYLAQTKAMLTMIQMRLNAVGEIIKLQINDINVIQFITTVDQVLSKFNFNLNTMMQNEIAAAAQPNDVVYIEPIKETPLSEDAQELISLLENYEQWVDRRTADILGYSLNEGIVNMAKEKAKEALVARKKALNEFDQLITRKVNKIRENRQNRKHSEMVGEALKINRDILRLFRTGVIGIFSPGAAAITFLVSFFYDRATDRKDRAVLVGQLKDELEIVEEKIHMAENKGDDKARIELIRVRQKLQREYEKITKIRYDAETRRRINERNMV